MFHNVLIGIDGRQGGRDAIALARQLAAPTATFTLAHAYGIIVGKGAMEAAALERDESRELLKRERALAGLTAELAVRGLRPVGRILHELAEERGADLLVVGSTRHALLGRVLLGDDCLAALDGAPCAVAVAPRGYAQAPFPLRRLSVGYNESPESERALSAARALAREHDATIHLHWVVSLEDLQGEKPIPADWPREVDELIELHTERLTQLKGVHGVVIYGGPREELAQAGQNFDLLIVGSRGYGPLGRLVHGSVSRYLARHAPCPLLVLPRAAVPEPEPEELLAPQV